MNGNRKDLKKKVVTIYMEGVNDNKDFKCYKESGADP